MRLLRRFSLGLPTATALAALLACLVLVPLLAFGIHTLVRNDIADEFVNSVRAQTREFGLRMADQPDLNAAHDLLQDWLIGGQIEFGEFVPIDGPVVRASLPQKDQYLNFVEDFQFGEHGDNNYFISVPVHATGKGLRGVLRLGFDERPVVQRIQVLYRQGAVILLAYVLATVAAGALAGLLLQTGLHDLQVVTHRAAAGRDDTDADASSALRIRDYEALRADVQRLGRALRKRERDLQRSIAREAMVSTTDRRLFLLHVQSAVAAGGESVPRAVFLIHLEVSEAAVVEGLAEFDEELLQTAVGRLLAHDAAAAVGERDVEFEFIARLGPRVLGLLQPGAATPARAERSAARLLEALQEPAMVGEHLVSVRAGIGIALYPQDGTLVEALVRNAEIAMIEAARQGGDCFCRYASLRDAG